MYVVHDLYWITSAEKSRDPTRCNSQCTRCYWNCVSFWMFVFLCFRL